MFTPWVVSRVTSYFVEDTELTRTSALLFAGLLFLCHCIYTIGRSWMFYSIIKLGTAIRISVSCLIYRKACRITQSEIGRTSVGHIINLMTNDAQRLDEVPNWITELTLELYIFFQFIVLDQFFNHVCFQYIVPAYVLLNIHVVLITSFLLMYKEIGIYGTLAGFYSDTPFYGCGLPLAVFQNKLYIGSLV